MDGAKLFPQRCSYSLLITVVEGGNRRPIGRASDAAYGIIERSPRHVNHLGL
jgi:hypothetical protein